MENLNDQDQDKSLVVAGGQQTGITSSGPDQSGLLTVHDMGDPMPDLYDKEAFEAWPLDLSSEYWTPQTEGEARRLLFSHIQETLVPDKYGPNKGANGETILLPTAIFYEMRDGEVKTIRQASKALLLALQGAQAKQGTLFEIVYKKRTRFSSGNTGDTWGVFPLKKLPPKPAPQTAGVPAQ